MLEKELINRCCKGEKSAFHEIIAAYYPYVFKFLVNLSHDTHLAEDLTQDTFIRLIRSIDKFKFTGKASFSTYLMTIAKNLYIDYFRKVNSFPMEQLDETLPSNFNLEDRIISEISCQNIHLELKSLPFEQADAIHLKYLEQLSLNEIAEKHGCESKTVKSRIHNGIIRLRRKLMA